MSLLREGDGVNFQKASCTLDGCVKIYTNRVDSVATETGKLLSGLADSGNKKKKGEDGEGGEEGDNEDGEEEDGEDGVKRRKKRVCSQNSATRTWLTFDTDTKNRGSHISNIICAAAAEKDGVRILSGSII